jgi:CRISPR system Cascade subunit CasD
VVSLGVHDGSLTNRLANWAWQASPWYQREHKNHRAVRLEILRDAHDGDPVTETMRDEPVTYDPTHRQHAWRSVVREHIAADNPLYRPIADHDPMDVLEGWTCT